MNALVVGGGIIGLATACELARDGHVVTVLERERPGSRASWVAAGLLTPSSPWNYRPALIDLAFRSEALYADFTDELLEHTGIDAEREQAGVLYPAGLQRSTGQIAEETRRRQALGFDVDLLDRAALDRLQPGFSDAVTGAGWQGRSGRVRPPRLLRALVRRAEQLGVVIQSPCDVRALLAHRGRVVGVEVATGQRLDADVVVLAAGSWSSALAATLGLTIDVRPVRGQILLLAGEPGRLGPTVIDGDGYLVPRRDGRILVGSTMEDAGFEAVNTTEALQRLRELAVELMPACASMTEEQAWAGLRPGTPDRLPYLGAVPDLPGLVLATGHFRNGILLAPVTARIVADIVGGRPPAVDTAPFAPREIDPAGALLPA